MQKFTNIEGDDEFEPLNCYNHYSRVLDEIEEEQNAKGFTNQQAEAAQDYFVQQTDFAVDTPNPLTDDEFDFNSTLHTMIPNPWDEDESEGVVNMQGS